MASDWQDISLDDLIEVKHGFAFQGEFFHDDPPGDVLLTPGNFAIGGGFKRDKFKYYRDGPIPKDFVLEAGDLLVTMTDLSKSADTLGYPALVPPSPDAKRYLHNQRLGKVLIKPGAPVEKEFLYYVLCGRDYRNEVIASATGTTVKHTSPTRIIKFRFLLPGVDEQRAIAKVLGTLDRKIDLNRELNETLESMAQALFRSWFIDFDPVSAKAERRHAGLPKKLAELFPEAFDDSEIGDVPQGWKVVALPEAVEVNPPRVLRRADTAPYLDMGNMPTNGHAPESVFDREFASGMRFTNGDTLVARITPCLENGKTAYVDFLKPQQVGWGSTEYIVLRAKPPLPPQYAYYLARSARFREFAIQSMTGTSGRQRVPVESLRHFLIALPPSEVAAAFGNVVALLMERIRAAVEQSKILAAIREALLPKLISGELRVPDAERIVGGHF